jgi:hypothetical protein
MARRLSFTLVLFVINFLLVLILSIVNGEDIISNKNNNNNDDDVQDLVVFSNGNDASELASNGEGRDLMKLTASQAVRFNIDLGYGTKITKPQMAGFNSARAKWSSVITKDSAASACVPAGATYCGFRFPRATCIDDLFIGVRVQKMDGVGKIAGSAGPCAVDNAGKVRIGVMTFDSADADYLIKIGAWESTILHEMGHVLGFGTLWEYEHLITSRTSPAPFYYTGVNGNTGLTSFAGPDAGQIVVEDQGGPGTARAHWKEDTYDSELMTGYLEAKGKLMPLSLMTARSLVDLGYTIDESKADPYTMPTAPQRRLRGGDDKKHGKIPVGDDIFKTEIIELKDDIIRPKQGREQEYQQDRERYATHKKKRQDDAK